MWKKEPESRTSSNQNNESHQFENSFSKSTMNSNSSNTSTASIGHTISINGKISGNEDLIIQGNVKGEIKLHKHTLSVGRNGKVNASIFSKIVQIDGEVQGDIEGSERVIINESGRVNGNIKSPRVILKDGSRFKGNIDMQQNEAENKPHISSSDKKSTPSSGATGAGSQNKFNSSPTASTDKTDSAQNTANNSTPPNKKKTIDLKNL